MINLTHVFEEQDILNKETALKHDEYSKLTRDQLTQNYVFAALVELGELANNWSHFKIWKSTRKENRDAPCSKCGGTGGINEDVCPYCENGRVNPLREEYVDVVHFVVSVAIGLDLDPQDYLDEYNAKESQQVSSKDSYKLYLELYKNLVYANILIDELESHSHTEKLLRNNEKERKKVAAELITTLLHLGYSMNFDDLDIEEAYFAKHKINQVRQESNY